MPDDSQKKGISHAQQGTNVEWKLSGVPVRLWGSCHAGVSEKLSNWVPRKAGNFCDEIDEKLRKKLRSVRFSIRFIFVFCLKVMQFGRIDGSAYTLDFQYPFAAVQAFSVALANVTQRLKWYTSHAKTSHQSTSLEDTALYSWNIYNIGYKFKNNKTFIYRETCHKNYLQRGEGMAFYYKRNQNAIFAKQFWNSRANEGIYRTCFKHFIEYLEKILF